MVHGERVTLRPVDPEGDLERCYQWVNDLEVTRFMSLQGPLTRVREREVLARERDPQHDIILAIEAEDGTHIGNCGLHGIDRRSRQATLGIMIGDKRYWSRGYGTDVVQTLCAFAFVELDLQRIELSVFAHNKRAQRCYEKCGFQLEGRLRRRTYIAGAYRDELRMGLLREEFFESFPQRLPEGVSAT